MKLHPELDVLFRQAEAAFKKSVREHGQVQPFALVMYRQGEIKRLALESDKDVQAIPGLIALLLPLARSGDIDASAMCTAMSAADHQAAIIDLEHRESFRAVAVIPYEKRSLFGWSFGNAQLTPDEPKLFAEIPITGVDIEHPHFHLHLGGDWRQVQNQDAEQFCFESAAKKSSIVISVMSLQVPQAKLVEAAMALAEARRKAELEASSASEVTLGEMLVDLKEEDQAGHVAYAGYDSEGRIFRFMGWVTRIKAFSLWVSTNTHDKAESNKVFGEILGALRLAIP